MKFLLNPAVTFRSKIKFIIFGFILTLVYILGISHLLDYLNPPAPSNVPTFFIDPTQPPIAYLFFMTVIVAPLWEELAFRHGPGLIVKALGPDVMLPVMLISSAIFGWGHGQGAESILRQGVMGFIFFSVYIKNGYSYWSSVLLHASWNAFVFFLV